MISEVKLDVKAPKRKNKVNTKNVIAAEYSCKSIFSAKKAKCPVTFVVNVFRPKTPETFTIPATNESSVAKRKLWLKVLFFPL